MRILRIEGLHRRSPPSSRRLPRPPPERPSSLPPHHARDTQTIRRTVGCKPSLHPLQDRPSCRNRTCFRRRPARADVRRPMAAVDKVDFERHIMGVFGRIGCNSGSCHGSFQGKGGFRLSLFGYDPEKDYLAITHELEGRALTAPTPMPASSFSRPPARSHTADRNASAKSSWAYQLFREWITKAPSGTKAAATSTQSLSARRNMPFAKPGMSGQLQVEADVRRRYERGRHAPLRLPHQRRRHCRCHPPWARSRRCSPATRRSSSLIAAT